MQHSQTGGGRTLCWALSCCGRPRWPRWLAERHSPLPCSACGGGAVGRCCCTACLRCAPGCRWAGSCSLLRWELAESRVYGGGPLVCPDPVMLCTQQAAEVACMQVLWRTAVFSQICRGPSRHTTKARAVCADCCKSARRVLFFWSTARADLLDAPGAAKALSGAVLACGRGAAWAGRGGAQGLSALGLLLAPSQLAQQSFHCPALWCVLTLACLVRLQLCAGG